MIKSPGPKICASCGRTFEYRRKWARCWDQVRYCSARCRQRRISTIDRALEQAIRDLLNARRGTICPSEAARSVASNDWRQLMESARSAARRLAAAGEVVILQRGQPVGPTSFKGPIRIGLTKDAN